jgi:hypothetical protein
MTVTEAPVAVAAPRKSPRWPVLAVALIVVGVGLGARQAIVGGNQTSQVATPRLSIVVLPFQNLSGDPHDDYLADGITDDLTSDLSRIPPDVRDRQRLGSHI